MSIKSAEATYSPGEPWTAAFVLTCGAQRIADAHNAALAAERSIKEAEKLILLDEIAKNKQLREQLAVAVEALQMMECECEPGITYVCTQCAALAKVKL